MTSPMERTLAECRKRGWIAEKVEHWNPYSKTRHDLFGCFDVVAIEPWQYDIGVLHFIQVCSDTGEAAERVKRLEDSLACRLLRGNSYNCEIWAWGKRSQPRKDGSKRGARKVWTLRVIAL